MTEIWLVRHGQTDWNLEGRYQGQEDIPLNETGLQQAQDLAKKLETVHFDAIYSSDLQRASQTAGYIAGIKKMKIQFDPNLREICQGEWEGMLFSDVVRSYEKMVEKRRLEPLNTRAPGGESVSDVYSRVNVVVKKIACAYPHGRVLLVAHGVVISTIFCDANTIPLSEVYWHIPEHTSPQIVQVPAENCN